MVNISVNETDFFLEKKWKKYLLIKQFFGKQMEVISVNEAGFRKLMEHIFVNETGLEN